MPIYGLSTKYSLLNYAHIWSVLALGCAPLLHGWALWLCAYAATRVVRPSPPRSRESWCSRRFLAPDILFPQDACNTNYRAPEFVDRCTAGEPVGAPQRRRRAPRLETARPGSGRRPAAR